jgi:D-Tyr-tRNAtyr deacylase
MNKSVVAIDGEILVVVSLPFMHPPKGNRPSYIKALLHGSELFAIYVVLCRKMKPV